MEGVKVERVLRMLHRNGWFIDRQSGSHRVLRHGERRGTVTVPGKLSDTLHPKTLDSILRQAGLTREDLAK